MVAFPSFTPYIARTTPHNVHSQSHKNKNIELSKSIIFTTSGLGGCLGWLFVHPLNTLAVRYNLASMSNKKFSFQTMVHEKGWISLYDGLTAGLSRQLLYATSRFGLFEMMRDLLHDMRGGKTDFGTRVAVGAITGGFAAYISCPLEVALVRMSNDSSLPHSLRRNYTSVTNAMVRIANEEGILAFWRCSIPSVQRAMMVGVFQVATFDQFKEMYEHGFIQEKNSILNVFCASMTSGLLYSIATMPLEASKNRMASQKKDIKTGKLPYPSTMKTLLYISRTEGMRALYNGFLPYYARCGGHTVSMFMIIQMLRDYYQILESNFHICL